MQVDSATIKPIIAVDIGGSLSKICWVSQDKEQAIPHESHRTIHFNDKTIFFNSFNVASELFQFIRANFKKGDKYEKIAITGGGSIKHYKHFIQLTKQLEKQLTLVQELQSVAGGLSIFKTNPQFQQFNQVCYTYQNGKINYQTKLTNYHAIQNGPFIVVNIGTGVGGFLMEDTQNNQLKTTLHGGTSIGGAFFMGLSNLLTGQTNFNKLIQMCEKGNVNHTDFTQIGCGQKTGQLTEESVLVSFAKLNKQSNPNDIVRSLFYLVSFNSAQMAISLSEAFNTKNIMFTGSFCRGNKFFLECVGYTLNFLCKNVGARNVYIPSHDGHTGALGALHIQLTKAK